MPACASAELVGDLDDEAAAGKHDDHEAVPLEHRRHDEGRGRQLVEGAIVAEAQAECAGEEDCVGDVARVRLDLDAWMRRAVAARLLSYPLFGEAVRAMGVSMPAGPRCQPAHRSPLAGATDMAPRVARRATGHRPSKTILRDARSECAAVVSCADPMHRPVACSEE